MVSVIHQEVLGSWYIIGSGFISAIITHLDSLQLILSFVLIVDGQLRHNALVYAFHHYLEIVFLIIPHVILKVVKTYNARMIILMTEPTFKLWEGQWTSWWIWRTDVHQGMAYFLCRLAWVALHIWLEFDSTIIWWIQNKGHTFFWNEKWRRCRTSPNLLKKYNYCR